MKKVLLLLVAVLVLSFGVFAQPGPEVTVPEMYPTIRAALNSGASVIRVAPGVYPENLFVSGGSRWIYAEEPGTVVIVGDNTANTITASPGTQVSLHGLRIINAQNRGAYNRAAIFAEFGAGLTLWNCQIDSGGAIGLSANYTVFVEISDSEFFGPQDSTALFLAHQNPGGVWLVRNRFFNVGVAVDASESYHRFYMTETGDGGDSSHYYFVRQRLIPQRMLLD